MTVRELLKQVNREILADLRDPAFREMVAFLVLGMVVLLFPIWFVILLVGLGR